MRPPPDDVALTVTLAFSDLEVLLDALDPTTATGVHLLIAPGRCRQLRAKLRQVLELNVRIQRGEFGR